MPLSLESESDQDDPFVVMKRQGLGQKIPSEINVVSSQTGSLEHTITNTEK